MKNFFKVATVLSLVLYAFVNETFAQRSTGINNTNPSKNAALDVMNNGRPQGVLFPRLLPADTTTIKTNMATDGTTTSDKGLMFFDTDNNVYRYWNGIKWISLGGSAASTPAGWALTGNVLPDTFTNYIGTTNSTPVSVRTKGIERIHVATNGSVGIGMLPSGTYILEIAGNLKTAGITETSDLRWKKDVKTLSNTLEKVGQLRGVSYNWRKEEFPEKNFDNKEQIGLIAQEVEKIYPQLVDTDALGFKSVQYSKVVALLIEALKEQQTEIGTLKTEVSKMSQLEQKVNSLTALVEILSKQNPVVETRK